MTINAKRIMTVGINIKPKNFGTHSITTRVHLLWCIGIFGILVYCL